MTFNIYHVLIFYFRTHFRFPSVCVWGGGGGVPHGVVSAHGLSTETPLTDV